MLKYSPIAMFFFCACGLFESNTPIAEVKIQGNRLLEKQEIHNWIGWNPEKLSAEKPWSEWESELEKTSRIQKAKVIQKRGVVEISLLEKEVRGIVHSEGDLWEFDKDFRIISRNDVRAIWLPILKGDFRLVLPDTDSPLYSSENSGRLEGALFESAWKQMENLKENFPTVYERLSEWEMQKDGDVFLYFHEPSQLTVNMGSFVSGKQARKLYSSLAYWEKESKSPRFMDLRGEDGFYY